MAKFLYYFLVVSMVLVLTAIGLGYGATATPDLFPPHVLAGIFSSLLAILGLVIVMFYFIFTGKVVKDAAIDKLVDAEDYYRTRKMKGSLFPWIMITVISFLAAPILGAAYDTGKSPLWVHHAAAWEALIMLVITTRFSRNLLYENKDIIKRAIQAVNDDVDKRRMEKGKDEESTDQTTQ
jgi:hypothetical protein